MSILNLREKNRTGSAQAEFGFIPKGPIAGAPVKFILWGKDKTVGLSYKPEAQ